MNESCEPFGMSLAIWGYDLSGNAAEPSALVGENPAIAHLWDQNLSYLARFDRWCSGQRLPIPEWWALPYVVEQEMVAA